MLRPNLPTPVTVGVEVAEVEDAHFRAFPTRSWVPGLLVAGSFLQGLLSCVTGTGGPGVGGQLGARTSVAPDTHRND